MLENIPFPRGAKPFRLRCDLADELCILDGIRAPLDKADIDDFLGRIGVTRIGLALINVVNDHRRTYLPRRFLCYYTAIPAGSTKPALRAYDGIKLGSLPLEHAGLFQDVLRWGVASVGIEPASLTVFLPEIPKPSQATITSPQAVLHDTARGVAAVVNFSTASSFVKSMEL